MEPENYTTPSCGSCEIHDASWPGLELELPDGEGFAPLPPRVSLEKLIQRNRQLRLWFPDGLRGAEERWRTRAIAEFQL